MQAWRLVTRANQGAEIDAETEGFARPDGTHLRPSDALSQPHICGDCGEPVRDRDHRAVFYLDCLRPRKNARDRAYNKANRERLNNYRRGQRVVS